MARLIPIFVGIIFGFILALLLVGRVKKGRPSDGRGKKYRDLEKQYRDLTVRFKEFDGDNDFRASRLRRTLWDVRGILANPEAVTRGRLETAVAEIDRALSETGPASEPGVAGN